MKQKSWCEECGGKPIVNQSILIVVEGNRKILFVAHVELGGGVLVCCVVNKNGWLGGMMGVVGGTFPVGGRTEGTEIVLKFTKKDDIAGGMS